MRDNAVIMMEERMELPEALRRWLQECIAAQATRLAALVADGSVGVSMAGGSPITEDEFPTLALPTGSRKRKVGEYAYSLHGSGAGKGASKGKGKQRAGGRGKGGGGAGRGR
jgi:hypothetical protein